MNLLDGENLVLKESIRRKAHHCSCRSSHYPKDETTALLQCLLTHILPGCVRSQCFVTKKLPVV